MGNNLWYYIKNYKLNSIFIKNLFIVLIFVITPLLIMSYTFDKNIKSIITKDIYELNLSSLKKTQDVVDNIFKEMELLIAHLSLQTNVQRFITSPNYTNYILQTDTSQEHVRMGPSAADSIIDNSIRDRINQYVYVYSYIDSVYVYSQSNNHVISNRATSPLQEFPDRRWDTHFEKEEGKIFLQSRKFDDKYPYFISMTKHVRYNNDFLGTIMTNIDVEEMDRYINNKESSVQQYVYIVDENRVILYSLEREKLGEKIDEYPHLTYIYDKGVNFSQDIEMDGQKYMVSVVGSNQYGIKYISYIPFSAYQDRLESANRFNINIIIIFTLIFFFVSILISAKTFAPMQNIMHIMEKPEQMPEHEQKGNDNELEFITKNILETIYSNKNLKEELETRLKLVNKMYTIALQAQINPHFLYNTLESINMSAIEITKGKNEVSSMVTDLAKLLRYSLEGDGFLVSIEEEINHVKLYVNILETRYHNKLVVKWDIDEEILNSAIVKLCIQPLIENAFYHGIKPTRKKGLIIVSGKKQDEHIVLEISDNGVGMSQEFVCKLNEEINNLYEISGEHIGLKNVCHRFKLVFGDNCAITVSSVINAGTSVKIEFPIILQ